MVKVDKNNILTMDDEDINILKKLMQPNRIIQYVFGYKVILGKGESITPIFWNHRLDIRLNKEQYLKTISCLSELRFLIANINIYLFVQKKRKSQ